MPSGGRLVHGGDASGRRCNRRGGQQFRCAQTATLVGSVDDRALRRGSRAPECHLRDPPVLLAWIAVWRDDQAPRFPSIRRLAASVVISVGLVAAQTGVSSLLKPSDSWPEAYWYLYDVAAISARTGDDLLPPSLLTGTEADVRAAFNPLAVEAFAGPTQRPLRFPRSEIEMDALRNAWKTAIAEHPVAWLRARWTTFTYQAALIAPATWAYHPFIDPNPYGFAPSNPTLDTAGRSYVDAFNAPNNNGGPLQTVCSTLESPLSHAGSSCARPPLVDAFLAGSPLRR